MSSVRLSAEIDERVRWVAALKGLTVSQVHRLALEEFCQRERIVTIDRTDFSVYRLHNRKPFVIVGL